MQKNILFIAEQKNNREAWEILQDLGYAITPVVNRDNIAEKIIQNKPQFATIDEDYFLNNRDSLSQTAKILQDTKTDFLLFSSRPSRETVLEAKALGAKDCIFKPFNWREFILRFNAAVNRKTRISCIGGGTGLFSILLGLKNIPSILLTSIVNMSDDGGSSGKLVVSFGILPPGDVRRSLVALSNAPELMNKVLQHRFEGGDYFSGHSFGNLFLTALAEIKGSMSEAVKGLGDILNIQGIVLPVTSQQTTLCAEFENGFILKGESKIDLVQDRDVNLSIKNLWLEPQAECDADVYASIINSDFIIIGPGDLYTSVITNLLVKNLPEAVSKTSAKKIYICNLMTKPGETGNYNALRHTSEVLKYLNGDYLDYLIISNTQLSQRAKTEYAKNGQFPVEAGQIKELTKLTGAEIILADVGHKEELVRHDSEKIKQQIAKIISAKNALFLAGTYDNMNP